jgi:hypothetical protein
VNQWTIAIRPAAGKKIRKITEIASLGGYGFSVLAPCHKAQSGFLFKQPVIPGRATPRFVAWDSAVAFAARDRAKLIYHADGFVEFAGEKSDRIAASKDLISGEAKGLGLYSLPLSRTSVGGPIISLKTYGLEEFQSSKAQDGVVVFDPRDFYYRNCTAESANTWDLVIYAFPKGVVPPVRFDRNRPMIAASLEPLNPPIASVINLVALSLPKENIFLGLFVTCFHMPVQSNSGWLLSGPGDWSAAGRGRVLMGVYPRSEIPSEQAPATGTIHVRPEQARRRSRRF